MKILPLLVLLSLLSTALFAQTPIDPKNFDEGLLEQKILEQINKVRDTIDVAPLRQDDILEKAAKHHTDYMTQNNKLGHYEEKKKYKRPIDRVKAYKGTHPSVAENVLKTSVKPEHDYESLAEEMVSSWVNSKGHFKNLSAERFVKSGISVAYDPKKKEVYATQVFGGLPHEETLFSHVPANTYRIQNYEEEPCQECSEVFYQMPPDVQFGVQQDSVQLYFIMTDQEWFNKVFNNKGDGIAVDVVSRQQFACGQPTQRPNSPIYKGSLQPPIYLSELQEKGYINPQGDVIIPLGPLPDNIKNHEVELNLLIIQDKHVCEYIVLYDLPDHKWELLDMGLYRDSIAKTQEMANSSSAEFSKTLQFSIPFERNKFDYNKADIQPLYDSLRLTNFDIRTINIDAYSSVEGPTDHNIYLQEKRAESIAKALQSFQSDKIQVNVTASENWKAFRQDIQSTPYKRMANWQDAQIKKKLDDLAFREKVEPVLAKHRLANISLELERKVNFDLSDGEQAAKAFNNAMAKKNLEEAELLQQAIYARIKDRRLPEEVAAKLEIPEENTYGVLLNHQASFKYEQNPEDILAAIKDFEKLKTLLPANKEIDYDLCVLRIEAYAEGKLDIDPKKLRDNIAELENKGFTKEETIHLMINFHIIYGEHLQLQKKYREKNKVLQYVKQNYQYLKLSEQDALNLAKYFAGYFKANWATQLLRPYAMKENPDEGLLFYFINLTIVDDREVGKGYYGEILEKAHRMNPQRFCHLFDVYGSGGITFQLLENEKLKRSYCAKCRQ